VSERGFNGNFITTQCYVLINSVCSRANHVSVPDIGPETFVRLLLSGYELPYVILTIRSSDTVISFKREVLNPRPDDVFSAARLHFLK